MGKFVQAGSRDSDGGVKERSNTAFGLTSERDNLGTPLLCVGFPVLGDIDRLTDANDTATRAPDLRLAEALPFQACQRIRHPFRGRLRADVAVVDRDPVRQPLQVMQQRAGTLALMPTELGLIRRRLARLLARYRLDHVQQGAHSLRKRISFGESDTGSGGDTV